jgi:hypothetical protein
LFSSVFLVGISLREVELCRKGVNSFLQVVTARRGCVEVVFPSRDCHWRTLYCVLTHIGLINGSDKVGIIKVVPRKRGTLSFRCVTLWGMNRRLNFNFKVSATLKLFNRKLKSLNLKPLTYITLPFRR